MGPPIGSNGFQRGKESGGLVVEYLQFFMNCLILVSGIETTGCKTPAESKLRLFQHNPRINALFLEL